MKIVFIGTVDFSYKCLEYVLNENGNVIGIATLKSSKVNDDFKDLTPISKSYNIPINYFKNVNEDDNIAWIYKLKPDIIFCFGISQLIKKTLLNLAPMGVLGVHPALLPKNRGRHPIIWALVLGLKESGLTFFFLDEGADSGDILSQKEIIISDSDNASSLYRKIELLAEDQIREFMIQLVSGTYKRKKQNHIESNYWRKRKKKDGIIDFRMTCTAIHNLIRALSKPYPGAVFYYNDQEYVVWKAETYTDISYSNEEPGKIIALENNLPVIKCYDGIVKIKNIQPVSIFTVGNYVNYN